MTEKGNGQFIGMLGVSWVGTVANFAAKAGSIFGALAALASLVASCYAIAIARRRLKAAGRVNHRRTEGTGVRKGGGRILNRSERRKRRGNEVVVGVLLALAVLVGQGCTFQRGKVERAKARVERQEAKLAEESRALTTGVVDALELARETGPVSAATELARSLAVVDQEIEGLPLKRLPVREALSGETNAAVVIGERVKAVEGLRVEEARLTGELKQKESALLAMGAKFEEERNRRITRWTKWSLGGLGLVGGLVALLVCCPVALPIAGRLLAWVVAKVPSMAGALGVVGKDAFDAVVRGVGAAREEMRKRGATAELGALDARLREETDVAHKELIEQRRVAVGV